jgi:hypothetical protein
MADSPSARSSGLPMDDSNTLRSTRSNLSGISGLDKAKEKEFVLIRAATQTTIGMPPPPPKPLAKEHARKIYIQAILGGFAMLTLVIFGVFSMFWGSIYKISTNTHKMVGWVVDFDNGPIGHTITSAIPQIPFDPTKVTWVIKSASDFPGGPQDLANAVHEQDVWFAVTVNPGASDALAAALASPQQNTNYTGVSAITGYGEEGRNENAFRNVFRPQLDVLIQPILADFAAKFAAENYTSLAQEQASAVLQSCPQLLSRPFYYSINNLRPFDIAVGPAMTFVGMIFTLVMSFMLAMASLAGRFMSGMERILPRWRLVLVRLSTDFVVYFFLSLFYCLVSLAYQAEFSRFIGKGGFVVYWMIQWIGMLALGYACETMMILLTPRFMPLFLLLWIVLDASVALWPIEILPGFFRYGYAMPFYNMAQGIRTVLFGTKSHLGLNFGTLFAWIGVSMICMPASMRFVIWFTEERPAAKTKSK